jgi:hypothetical protein
MLNVVILYFLIVVFVMFLHIGISSWSDENKTLFISYI